MYRNRLKSMHQVACILLATWGRSGRLAAAGTKFTKPGASTPADLCNCKIAASWTAGSPVSCLVLHCFTLPPALPAHRITSLRCLSSRPSPVCLIYDPSLSERQISREIHLTRRGRRFPKPRRPRDSGEGGKEFIVLPCPQSGHSLSNKNIVVEILT